MKFALLALAAFVASPAAFAVKAPNMCEAGAKLLTGCVANAFLPAYPFLNVCQDDKGVYLVLDDGREHGKEPVVQTETATTLEFKANDEEIPDLELSLLKADTHGGTNATLTYNMFGAVKSGYVCTASSPLL